METISILMNYFTPSATIKIMVIGLIYFRYVRKNELKYDRYVYDEEFTDKLILGDGLVLSLMSLCITIIALM